LCYDDDEEVKDEMKMRIATMELVLRGALPVKRVEPIKMFAFIKNGRWI